MQDRLPSLGRHSADSAYINLRHNYALKRSEIQATQQELEEEDCRVEERSRAKWKEPCLQTSPAIT